MEPMSANCCKYSGLQSVLAPISITRQTPSFVGKMPPSAGRSTPTMRLSVKSEAAIIAPLLPADTAPSAAPSRTCCSAIIIEALFLRRTAVAGCSSISMTSSVWMMGRSRPWVSCLASSARIASSRPTRYTPSPYSRAACTAPSTTSPGALSPPIASRATRTFADSLSDEVGLISTPHLAHQLWPSLSTQVLQDRRAYRQYAPHQPGGTPAPPLLLPGTQSQRSPESADRRPSPSASVHRAHPGMASSDRARQDQVGVRAQHRRNADSVLSYAFRNLRLPTPPSADRQSSDRHP